MKRNWIRNIIGGISLASALFIFQACYGTNQDFINDLVVEGQVRSELTGEPIKGIKVSISDTIQYQLTNEDGRFYFYTPITDSLTVNFEDIDSLENGSFQNKDTLIHYPNPQIFLDITLEEL